MPSHAHHCPLHPSQPHLTPPSHTSTNTSTHSASFSRTHTNTNTNTLQWLTYAPVASNAATYFSVRESAINWLSTAFFLSFVVVSPISLYALQHHHGLRISLALAALLLLLGNWIRYAGSTSKAENGGKFAYAMAGEILIGFAQPFVLAAPTRYSDLWFTNRGRVAATALTTLANPFGAALGQLINPFWVSKPGDVSDMVLWVSVIVSLTLLIAFLTFTPGTFFTSTLTRSTLHLASPSSTVKNQESN
jgi:hypothetical protein